VGVLRVPARVAGPQRPLGTRRNEPPRVP
jgi:hypothetical protein